MFYSRFPCLPLPPARPAPAEVAATNGAAELEPDLAAKRAKAAAAARARRARRRTAREAAPPPRRNGRAGPAPELDPPAIVEQQAGPAPVRVCERCGAAPVTGPASRYCGTCRELSRREALQRRQKAPSPALAAWPEPVAALTDRLRYLEDKAEVAERAALPGIRSQIRAVAAELEAAKQQTMSAGAPS